MHSPASMIRGIMLVTVLTHVVFSGSRVLVALFAIKLEATPLTVGIMMALYALVPMFLAVPAGRMMDRIGVRKPLLLSGIATALSPLVAFFWPGLPSLFIVATLVGTFFSLFHLAVQNATGAIGNAEDRAVNFSWMSLAFSMSGLIGPLLAGFCIDGIGHVWTFLVLSLFPVIPVALMLAGRIHLPEPNSPRGGRGRKRVADLFREPAVVSVFITSAIISISWDLYIFVVPIYGTSIGLSASTIGLILGSFSAATFVIRVFLPRISRTVAPWRVLTMAMLVGAGVYFIFPAVHSAGLLMLLSFVLGLGIGSAQPMVMAVLYDVAPPGRAGEAVGVRTMLVNGSQTVIPLMFGALGTAVGMAPVFLTMATVLGWGAWYARSKRGRNDKARK